MTQDEAVQRTLATLCFFANAPHGPQLDATGHKDFYYHFLDMNSGQRAWCSELSSVDTAFLLAGMLAAAYYQQQTADEDEVRKSPYHFGINQGPIVMMIENHRSGFLWSLMRQCPYLVAGLRRAGFTGGWLE